MEGKLLVAAYCRVSTDSRDQTNSLENQKRFFNHYITHNEEWSFVKLYVDEGISGTSVRKRNAFQEMLEDAYNHHFQILITKEISRFARNTLDSIYYTRKLKELGIGVIFLNDNINTLDSDAELRLTIMSSIAQEESRRISERVKWGQRRSMEQGVVFGRALLGYDVIDGALRMNEREADIVRTIFKMYLEEGKGAARIATILRESSTPTAPYMKDWSATSILRILRNEKYCGDLRQRKTFTPNYLTHEKKMNKGEEEYVTVSNHHEAIIDRKTFESVQQELKRRGRNLTQRSRYSNRYCFSGKITCGECHASLVSRSKVRKNGSEYRAWRCLNSLMKNAACKCTSINEEYLREILCEVMHELPIDRKEIVDSIMNLLARCGYLSKQLTSRKVIEKARRRLDILKRRKERLVELYLMEGVELEEYRNLDRQISNEVSEIERLLAGKSGREEELKSVNTEVKLEQDGRDEELKSVNTEGKLERDGRDEVLKRVGTDDNPKRIETEEENVRNEQAIKDFLNSVVAGDRWEERFYQRILNRVVISEDSISLSLAYLPGEWRYQVTSF